MKHAQNVTLRGGMAFIASAAVTCIYCATVSLETVFFGLAASLFIIPSIALFLMLERFYSKSQVKFIGFLCPTVVIVLLVSYQLIALRSQTSMDGVSDGASDILLYFIKCYAIGLCVGFAYLLLKGGNEVKGGQT